MSNDDTTNVLRPGQTIKPIADKNTASELVNRLYGLKVKQITELNAYDDKNFHIICEEDSNSELKNPWIKKVHKEGYVLKIINSLDSRKTSFFDGQTEMLKFLNDNDVSCPLPVKNLNNCYYSLENLGEGSAEKHLVRLLTYRPGDLLDNVEISNELLVDVGEFTARLDNTLKKFHHTAYDDYKTLWMLSSVPKLRDFVYAVDIEQRRSMVNDIITKFENEVIENLDKLEAGIIHGDLNEHNILVDEKSNKITAVLDLGDSQKSCLIFELSIAICYMILKVKSIDKGKYVVQGYQRMRKLSEFEREILKICVCARICQSLVLGAYSHLNDPQNEYLLSTQKSGWNILEKLWPIDNQEIFKIWKL